MTIEYNEFKGKMYGRISQLNDGEQSQDFEAVYDKIYEGDEKEGKDGSKFTPLRLKVKDEDGVEVTLSVTNAFRSGFEKAGLGRGSKFRVMKAGRTCVCVPLGDTKPASKVSVTIPKPQVTLTDTEKQIVEAYKEHVNKHSEEDLTEAIKQTLKEHQVNEDRAKVVYEAAKSA